MPNTLSHHLLKLCHDDWTRFIPTFSKRGVKGDLERKVFVTSAFGLL
jgi:hypothetical protein